MEFANNRYPSFIDSVDNAENLDDFADNYDSPTDVNSDLPDLSSLNSSGLTTDYKLKPTTSLPFDDGPIGPVNHISSLPPPSKESVKRTKELRLILQMYANRFEDHLTILSQDLANTEGMDEEELKELRDQCDFVLGANSAVKNDISSFNALIYTIEQIAISVDINIYGTTKVLLNDADFQRDIERLSLKYLTASRTKPEVAVGMRFLTTAMSMYRVNTEIVPSFGRGNSPQPTDQQLPPSNFTEVNDRFSDL